MIHGYKCGETSYHDCGQEVVITGTRIAFGGYILSPVFTIDGKQVTFCTCGEPLSLDDLHENWHPSMSPELVASHEAEVEYAHSKGYPA